MAEARSGSRPPGRRAIFRADASVAIGTGHVARCRTLGAALARSGWHVTLATRRLPAAIAAELDMEGIATLELDAASIDREAAEIASQSPLEADLIVADHYDLGPDWFAACRRSAPQAVTMAISDAPDRHRPVDLLLDQNLGASAAAYKPLGSPATRLLIGPAYALLRPEFAALRDDGRVRDGRVHRILVFLSGADVADVTARAVTGLSTLGIPLDVVVGAAYPQIAGLRELVAPMADVDLHVNTADMAGLMSRADLAVGAPGSASWERCALGLPAVVVRLADNQSDAERKLVEIGAVRSLGWHQRVTAAAIGSAVRALVEDPPALAAMSRAAAGVTDGRGTARVVAEIESITASGTEHR